MRSDPGGKCLVQIAMHMWLHLMSCVPLKHSEPVKVLDPLTLSAYF